MPSVNSLALRISRRKALPLASRLLSKISGSLIPIIAEAITPIPPSFATAAARPERDIPTPIPPWIIGILTFRSPNFNSGIFTIQSPHNYKEYIRLDYENYLNRE